MFDRPTIRAVAFDFDGLMFNTEQVYELVDRVLLERRNRVSDPEVVAEMMGRPGKIALQIMIDAFGLDDAVDSLERESQQLYLELIEPGVDPMPGLFELLDLLESNGIPKSIATSSRPKMVMPLLEKAELTERFQFLLSADDVTRHKPDPQIYQLAADRFGVPCSDMLVLEDSTIGCRAAVAAGAFAVAVPSKHAAHQSYDGARFVAESLADKRIDGLFA